MMWRTGTLCRAGFLRLPAGREGKAFEMRTLGFVNEAGRGSCLTRFAMRLACARTTGSRNSPRRGVSLIELLVVLAILLLVFAMAGVFVGPPLKRARLASAAMDVEVLAKQVPIQSRTRRAGQGLFVFLRTNTADRTFELVADTNPAPAGDGRFQDPDGASPTDVRIADVARVRLPDRIVFYHPGAPYGASWANWGTTATGFAVGIDYQGRTVRPAGGQIGGPAVLFLTHADMISGAVTPLVVHRISIGPVWSVRQTRLVRDAGAATGWREF